MPRVAIENGVRLYCQDLGSGSTIVLVHGGCMSHRVWESQVQALVEAGFRVITPDLRGHGCSDKPVSPYTARMYSDDLAALLDACEIDECTLVGWSLGATIAATFARRYSDRLNGMILVSSSLFRGLASLGENERDESDLPIHRMIANQQTDRPKGMERFVSGMFDNGNEWTIRWLWSIGMETPMRVAIKSLEIYIEMDYMAIHEGLQELAIPSAVFHGASDRAATIEDAESIAVDVLQDGTFVLFENSAHAPFLDEPIRFNDELLAFLKKGVNDSS